MHCRKFSGAKRWGGMVGDMLRKAADKRAPAGSPMTDFTPETEITKEVCKLPRLHILARAQALRLLPL